MEDKKVTAEEIKAILADDIDTLAEEMAAAMNAAKAGRIIADSEESRVQVPQNLGSELGSMRLVPEERTIRMLEVLFGSISVDDPLWQSTFQSLQRNRVSEAVKRALQDPRFREKHGRVSPSGRDRYRGRG